MLEDQKSIRISVVTIALNAARDLPLTIESVLAQDYPHIEYIVVDGQSWDESHDVLERYRSHVDKIIVREDSGIYAAMNASLDDITGDYVIFLNAGDQFFSADAVGRMVAGVKGRPDIFYGNHVYVNQRQEWFKRAASFAWLARKLHTGSIDHVWHSAVPGHQATFTKADLLRRLKYDTKLLISADHEFLFRAHAAGAEMQYIDEIVAHYHGGGFSAVVGELTKTEGVSVYRRFSDNPVAVDRFFYPDGSPFRAETARTGFCLTGFLAPHEVEDTLAGEENSRWVSGGPCELLSPAETSQGLILSGSNRLKDQSVTVSIGDCVIATAELPESSFRIGLEFDQDVAPNSIITLRAGRMAEVQPGLLVAFSMRSVQLTTANSRASNKLGKGDTLVFNSAEARTLADTLGAGWSSPEKTHIWSVGPRSELWIGLDSQVAALTLEIGGNPHVPDGCQLVALVVNGETIDQLPLSHGERRSVRLETANPAWRRNGVNHLLFVPDRYGSPPDIYGDFRELGVCLWKIDAD